MLFSKLNCSSCCNQQDTLDSQQVSRQLKLLMKYVFIEENHSILLVGKSFLKGMQIYCIISEIYTHIVFIIIIVICMYIKVNKFIYTGIELHNCI